MEEIDDNGDGQLDCMEFDCLKTVAERAAVDFAGVRDFGGPSPLRHVPLGMNYNMFSQAMKAKMINQALLIKIKWISSNLLF